MSTLHIASWNTTGLNGPTKHSMCLDWLKRHKIDVAFIQESHLKPADKYRLVSRHYYTVAAAAFNSKSRGALVLVRRSLSLTIIESYGSEDGRIAYIKTNINGLKVALLCIYAPNQFSLDFFEAIGRTLCNLQGYSNIIGADMNAILDPVLDRSSIPPQNTHPSTVAFQGLINDFSLTDLFRAINPSVRQYSFYSDRHKSYSRIDYLLVTLTSFSEIHSAVIHTNSI